MTANATQKPGARAGIIASASIGLVIFIVGAFFAGVAIGYNMRLDAKPERSIERPTAGPTADGSQPTVLGRWQGDIEGADPGTVELNLQTANSFGGSDGCNQGGGDWKLDGSTVYFANARSTMKACLDLGDPYLFQAVTGEVSEDGSTMELFDSEGEPIGTLYRAGKASVTLTPKEEG